MEILRVSSWNQSLPDEFLKYNIIVYDGNQPLYSFLEEVGRNINKPQLKFRLKFCKNIRYSKPISAVISTENGQVKLENIRDFHELLMEINKYKNDLDNINIDDMIIIESNDKKEFFDTVQQTINIGMNISVYSRKELEERRKVENFLKKKDKFKEAANEFYKKIRNIKVDVGNKIINDLRILIEGNMEKIINALEKIEDKDIKVGVVATKKAGKSMIVNAFLKEEYAPTSSELATPCVIEYIPVNNKDKIELYEKIYKYNKEETDNVEEKVLEKRELIGSYSKPEEVKAKLLEIFKESNMQGKRTSDFEIRYPSKKGVNYIIYDTPGPDLAGSEHKIGLKETINASDVIIFVIDYSKYATESEKELFEEVLKLFDKKDTILIVAINKVDSMYNDQDSEKIYPRVTDFIIEKYKELGCTNMIAIPTSAMWYFYLLKTAEKNPDIEQDIEQVEHIEDDSISAYTTQIDHIISILQRQYKKRNPTYKDAILLSGFETLIRYANYIAQEKAYIHKVSKLISDIDIALNTIANGIESYKVILSKKIESIRVLMEDFQKRIKEIDDSENLKQRINKVEERFTEIVEESISKLKNIQSERHQKIYEHLIKLKTIIELANKNIDDEKSYKKFLGDIYDTNLNNFDAPAFIKEFSESLKWIIETTKTSIIDNIRSAGDEYSEHITKIYSMLAIIINDTNEKLKYIMAEEAKTFEIKGIQTPKFKPTIDFSDLKINIDNLNIKPIYINFFELYKTKEKIIDHGPGFLWWREIFNCRYEKVETFDKEASLRALNDAIQTVGNMLYQLKRYVDDRINQITNGFVPIKDSIRNAFKEAKDQYDNFINSIKTYANNALEVINVDKKQQEEILRYIVNLESGEDGSKNMMNTWINIFE